MESANQLPTFETNNLLANVQNKVIPSSSMSVEQEEFASLKIRTYKLRVITANVNYEVFYLVNPNTLMKRLKTEYCISTNFKAEDIYFTYRTHIITDNDTPDMLGMQNGDTIIVQMNCEKECKCHKIF